MSPSSTDSRGVRRSDPQNLVYGEPLVSPDAKTSEGPYISSGWRCEGVLSYPEESPLFSVTVKLLQKKGRDVSRRHIPDFLKGGEISLRPHKEGEELTSFLYCDSSLINEG